MGRLFVYDENMTDERAKITVEKMAAVADITAPEKAYIAATGDKTLSVIGGCVIGVGGSIFQTAETNVAHHASVYLTAYPRASGLCELYRSIICLWVPAASLHPIHSRAWSNTALANFAISDSPFLSYCVRLYCSITAIIFST